MNNDDRLLARALREYQEANAELKKSSELEKELDKEAAALSARVLNARAARSKLLNRVDDARGYLLTIAAHKKEER